MGNKNRNRVKKSISPFVKWGKWGGDGVKAFVYAIIFTIVGSDGAAYHAPWNGAVQAAAQSMPSTGLLCSDGNFSDDCIWEYGRDGQLGVQGSVYVFHAACGKTAAAHI